MKINRVTIWKTGLTSHETYYMASGKTCDTVDTIVVSLDTDEGISGWGEVCPIPHYLPAYADGVLPAVQEMASVLLGANPLGPEAVMAKLDTHLIDHRYAKSPIDIALWDITARKAKLPLYALLGGKRQEHLPLYHSITCIDPGDMVRIAKDAYAKGIRQFQAKLGADDNWQTDVERLIKVREAVGDGPLVYGDWNCGSTRLDATRVARAVAKHDIMLEQPCDTIEQCAEVRRSTGLPMKLDENAHDSESLLRAYELGCMDAVAIKLSKFGGISKSRQARDLCTYLGVKMCVEDTWGSDITTAALLHLAASSDPRYLLNTCDLSGYVAPRLASDCPVRSDGFISAPEGHGLGISPDLDILGEPIAIIE
ncbi:MAG: enolase C-terminal domain-like protein [Rhizobiaceae bacterium]|nr:enolase C-terminal domain-like protein [Rhizobiaceae bacterium]